MAHTVTAGAVIIPDLFDICDVFPCGISPLDHIVTPASDRWLEAPGSTAKARMARAGLKGGMTGSLCHPYCDNLERLQICADFGNYLFHLDDLTDEMDLKDADTIREAVMGVIREPDIWKRRIESKEAYAISVLAYQWVYSNDSGPLVQKRFELPLDRFFITVTEETKARKMGVTPNLDQYIELRRNNGGVRSCFALIELSRGFELPEHVWSDPVIRQLDDWAVDLVCWVNDVLSFGVEYARGDTYNLVIVVMRENNLSVQQAMDYSAQLIQRRVDDFVSLKAKLPSWSPDINRAAGLYIEGMEYWVTGTLQWCFSSNRYFGDEAVKVKQTRIMPFQHPKPREVLF